MSIDQMESCYYTAIAVAITMVFGDLLMLFMYYQSKSGHMEIYPVVWDLAWVFTIALVISIVIIIKFKKKIK
ncbi:MAG: hypothetical protein Q4F05_13150 [bacterium]|nr:hypothetical protein [bacterium]